MEKDVKKTKGFDFNRALLPEEVEVRTGSIAEGKKDTDTYVQLFIYINARAARNYLDWAFGPENWSNTTPLPVQGKDGYYTTCTLEITTPNGNVIKREDVGEGKKPKGAASDALKRATATIFPAIRALYSVESLWVSARKLGITAKDKDTVERDLKKKDFQVFSISFANGATGMFVQSIQIIETKSGDIVAEKTNKTRTAIEEEESPELSMLRLKIAEAGVTEEKVLEAYKGEFGVSSLEELVKIDTLREAAYKRIESFAEKKKEAKKKEPAKGRVTAADKIRANAAKKEA